MKRIQSQRFVSSALLLGLGFVLGVGVALSWIGVDTSPDDVPSRLRTYDEKHTNKQASLKLAILVMTAAHYSERRAAARATWLKSVSMVGMNKRDVRHWFVVGSVNLSSKVVDDLHREQVEYGDILLLQRSSDEYSRLTDKVLAAFSWVSSHLSVEYVLKCDDDSYVRVGELLRLLTEDRQWRAERLYAGFFDGRARPMTRGAWKETDWDLCDHYLPYALGGGYVISGDLVRYLAASEPLLRRFNSEDVSVGAWLAPISVRRLHEPRFDTEFRSRGCDNRYLVTHKQSPTMMLDKHRSLEMTGRMCTREFRSRGSYIYNWTQTPSKCCQRATDYSIP